MDIRTSIQNPWLMLAQQSGRCRFSFKSHKFTSTEYLLAFQYLFSLPSCSVEVLSPRRKLWAATNTICHYCTLRVLRPCQSLSWFIVFTAGKDFWWLPSCGSVHVISWYHESQSSGRGHSCQLQLRYLWILCLKCSK